MLRLVVGPSFSLISNLPPNFIIFVSHQLRTGKKNRYTLFFAPRFFFALVFWPDNGAVVGTKRKHFLFFLPLPHILVTQATCWLNTLAHCRRTTAANIASSSWHTSSPMDQSSTRAACLTQSRATGHLGRVSAPANSPNSIGSASRWPSTISRQSSIRPCRWPSSSAYCGGRASSTSNSVYSPDSIFHSESFNLNIFFVFCVFFLFIVSTRSHHTGPPSIF